MPDPAITHEPMDEQDALAVLILLLGEAEGRDAMREINQVADDVVALRNASVALRIKTQLDKAIREGQTRDEFIGWLAEDGAAWERYYDTQAIEMAVQTAYVATRWRTVRTSRQAIRYDAVMDSRTTEFCRSLNGRWWLKENFPTWYYPPNHWGCRSVVRIISKVVAMRVKAKQLTGSVPGLDQDQAFASNSAATWAATVAHRRRIVEAKLMTE